MKKDSHNIREQLIQREMNTCVHFNGLINEKCKADVVYESLRQDNHIPPCIKHFINTGNKAISTCPLLQFPSREEAEKIVDEDMKKTEDTFIALAVVQADADQRGFKKGHPGGGTIKCPICEGVLLYHIASNGHIHGRCETLNCVQWMQ